MFLKSVYKCQIIQLLMPDKAAILCQKMGRFAFILSEVLCSFAQAASDKQEHGIQHDQLQQTTLSFFYVYQSLMFHVNPVPEI